MSEVAPGRVRPWHAVAGVAGTLVVAALVVGAIGRVAGFADVREVIADASFGWLGLCAAGQLIVFAGYAGALRHAVAFEDGPVLRYALSVRLTLASFAATQLFAFAGMGGLALVYWALRRLGIGRRESAIRLIGLNTAVYLVFGALGWTAAGWAALSGSAPAAMVAGWLVGVPLILLAARWFTAPRRVDRWTAAADDSRASFTRRALATGVGAAWWVRRALAAPAGRGLFWWAACYWIGDLLSLWAALRAFDSAPAVAALILAYATGYLAQSLPIPFVATGGMDAATTVLLNVVGVPLDAALVGVVAHRIFAFWLPVIPASVLAVLIPRTGRELASVGAAAAQRSDR
jgi:uncharacterized membrane protein YbhN (UPF0104 family)